MTFLIESIQTQISLYIEELSKNNNCELQIKGSLKKMDIRQPGLNFERRFMACLEQAGTVVILEKPEIQTCYFLMTL